MRNILIIVTALVGFLFSCDSNSESTKAILNKSLDSLSIPEISAEIRKTPKNAELFIRRAELYFYKMLLDSAINDAVISTRLDSLNPKYFIRLSELYLTNGKSEDSKLTLEKCNRINPNNEDVLVKLGTLYFYVKDYKKATEYLDMAAMVNPNCATMFFVRGMIHRDKKDNKAAILNFQKATENNSDYYEAYMMLGMLFSEMKDSIAIQYYKTASNLNPTDVQPHYNLGMYYQDNGKYDQALFEYQYILKNLDKSNSYAYFNQGYIHMIYGTDYATSIQYFDSAIAAKPDYVEAIYNKGYCYEKLKNFEKARNFYNQAKDLVTNYQLAVDGLNRIDKKK
jgi:tetratricopeptide (TPR) repeat protein